MFGEHDNTDAIDTSGDLGGEDTTTDNEESGASDEAAGNENESGQSDDAAESKDDGNDNDDVLGSDNEGDDADGDEDKESDDDDDGDKNELIGAPEDGEYGDFELPEGVEEFDQEAMDALLPMMKDMNISKAGVQQLLNQQAAHLQKTVNTLLENQAKKWTDTVEQWKKDLRSDDELGGAKFKERMSVANAGLKAFDKDGSLRELAKQMNLTNNPSFVRAFYQIGKLTASDGVGDVSEGGKSEKEPTISEILFP